MATVRQKVKRAQVATQKVEEFVAAGGDLKSQAAVTVGLNFMSAFADLAAEFGYYISKPVKKQNSTSSSASEHEDQ